MISETTLINCKNVPDEMAGRFDEPWIFVGDVKGARQRHHRATCSKCAEKLALDFKTVRKNARETFQVVELKGYLFITDDMLECMVYFGVCDKCDSVHWARQGPPFRRARCLVHA